MYKRLRKGFRAFLRGLSRKWESDENCNEIADGEVVVLDIEKISHEPNAKKIKSV